MSKKLIQAAAGTGGESVYVEDVFSTYLYEGSNAARTIDNGIALSDEGGLVWLKQRGAVDSHILFDTVNGPQKSLSSNSTAAGADYSSYFSFPSAGTEGWNLSGAVANGTGTTWASWSFRKQAGFFDVVTYTGTGSTRTVSHNLGSTPGFFIVKRTDIAEDWTCWHTGVAGTANYIQLNKTDAYASNPSVFNNTAPTDSEFTVGSHSRTNASGGTYVAYLFAHDDQSFGDNSDESIIKCGSFTGAANTDVNLGWEPQWVMFKNTTNASNWQIVDMMRGYVNYSPDKQLMPNLTNAESDNQLASPTATGFTWIPSAAGNTYIYVAIRKPMKIPESGSEVFGYQEWTGNDAAGRKITLSGVDRTDLFIHKRSDANAGPYWTNRHLGRGSTSSGLYGQLTSSSTSADDTSNIYFDTHNGVILESTNQTNGSPDPFLGLGFKRARGFMDIVPWTGDGSSSRNINHNLGVVPELIIAKRRDSAQAWPVYVESLGTGTSSGLRLNTSDGTDYSNTSRFPSTPTSSVFTIGNDSNVNTSSGRYVAYLFATLAGVSKVGSVTVSGSTNVDCGFSSAARFIMLKRAEGIGVTGDWFVFYKVVSGNDTYFRFNDAGAKVTTSDFVGTYSSGFTVESGFTNGDYIFLAIA
jgi:hypothetical protein